jgi:hypothetical protein
MNQFNIDYDFPGLCAKCHTEIAEFRGSHPNGTPIISRLKPEYTTTTMQLNDGSSIRISLCSECKFSLAGTHCQEIMESVINGWQSEVERANWDDKELIGYMRTYCKKHITGRKDVHWGEKEKKKIKKPRKEKIRFKDTEPSKEDK